MSESSEQKLLVCETDGCDAQFVDEVNKALEGDAASLPSALKAHKAGWLLAEGKILCPACAKGYQVPS